MADAPTNGSATKSSIIDCPQCNGDGKKSFEMFVGEEPQGIFKTFVCGNCEGRGVVPNVQEEDE